MKIIQILLFAVATTSVFTFHFGIIDQPTEYQATQAQQKTYKTHNKIESILSKIGLGNLINPFTQSPKPHPIMNLTQEPTSSSSSSGGDPHAKTWALKWTMPFTETLYLKNSFTANKAKPNHTTGVFYYDFNI